MLETAADPYAAELGARETAASRLNLAQSFNGLGCIVAPAFCMMTPIGGAVAYPLYRKRIYIKI